MSLSVILTCYNEVPLIFDTYNKISSAMNSAGIDYEMVIVDDGTSPELKEELVLHFNGKQDTVLLLSDLNEGRGAAVTKGIRASRKEYAGFIDTDLEIPESCLLSLYKTIDSDGLDAVIGKRIYRPCLDMNHWIRYAASRVYFLIANIALGLRRLDTETGIKIFRRERILPLLDSIRDKRWFWDTEIMAECIKRGLRVSQVPVPVLRKKRRSSVSIFRDSIRYIKAIYKYRRRGRT